MGAEGVWTDVSPYTVHIWPYEQMMDAPAIDASEAPQAITPPTGGFEADVAAGTEDEKQANSGNVFAVIALMPPAVAVGSGVWFWEKGHEENVQ